jgi:penicillin-binding protein 1A
LNARRKASSKGKGRALLAAFIWGIAGFFLLLSYFIYDLPAADRVKPLDVRPGIVILANDGTVLARYGGLKGDTVFIEDLPPYLIAAVLAIEDRRFYSHFGIDPLGLARAMWVNLKAGRFVQGGSTITQQLAKNLFLTPNKTLRRKAQEALMALWIERKFTKDQILGAYLNRVYFGAGAYGVDSAARVYFGHGARQLTLWESAVLAGLLKAPSRYSPATNPELAEERAKVVIRAMQDAGYLSADMAGKEIRHLKSNPAMDVAGGASRYFTDWLIDQIDSFVAVAERDIVVHTTLDPRLQLLAEEKQAGLLSSVPAEEKISQAALVTLGRDGAVLAMTGGVDYGASQFNRATQARRQPGSSFKPFVFLAALEAGFSPGDKIEDAPIRNGSYRPGNYDDKYYGAVTLTQALAKSLNTATVRLLSAIGVARLIDVAARMGFTSPLPFELSTGLGTAEVSLLELANAYAIIANGGYAVTPYAVLSIKDGDGNILYRHEYGGYTRNFSARDMNDLGDMLVQAVAQGTGQAAQLSKGLVAGKTGTTQNYRDAWFVGYTDRLVTGIWMGNDDNTGMKGVTGGKYPARLWRAYMNEAINIDIPIDTGNVSGASPFSDLLKKWSSGGWQGSDQPVYNQ